MKEKQKLLLRLVLERSTLLLANVEKSIVTILKKRGKLKKNISEQKIVIINTLSDGQENDSFIMLEQILPTAEFINTSQYKISHCVGCNQ